MDSIVPHRRAVYWTCQVCGWAAHFVISVIAAQSFAPISSRTVAFYLFLSVCGLLLTHGFRGFVRRRKWSAFPVGRLLPRVLSANLAMSLAMVGSGFVYSILLAPVSPGMHREGSALLAAIFFFVFNDFTILTLWTVIYFGVAYFEREQRAERERYQSRTALAEAELRGLKRQLNPHFLFNALNSLRSLVVEDPPRAQSAVTQLAGILRYHLTSGERSLVSLEEELATVQQYLALELMRFEDRLSVVSETDPRAKSCLVPPLAVQTLVENAIKYGVSRDDGAGRVEVKSTLNNGQLRVTVGNTGTLQASSAQNSTGLGLTNLRTRLALLFGDDASVELEQISPTWVEARFTLQERQSLEGPAR